MSQHAATTDQVRTGETAPANPLGVWLVLAVLVGAISSQAFETVAPGIALIAVGIVGLFALFRPDWALIGYLAFSAKLPSSEGISLQEMATFGLLLLLFGIATVRRLHMPPASPLARSITRGVYAVFAAAGISLPVALMHGTTAVDWARDAVPLANLALVVMVPMLLLQKREIQALRSLYVVVCALIGASWAWMLAGSLVPGRPAVWLGLTVGGTWLTALLVSGGVAALAVRSQATRRYLLLAPLGLLIAALGPTRTVWVGAALVVAVALLGFVRAGRLVSAMIAIAIAGTVVMGVVRVWQTTGRMESWEYQQARFRSLRALSEDQSFRVRQEQLKEALRQFVSSPILGVGLGYQYHYKIEFTGEKYAAGTNYNHSDLANALCKMGLVGTIPLYLVLLWAIRLAGQVARHSADVHDRWFGTTAYYALIAALVMGNSCPILQERGTTVLLGLLMGLLVALAPTAPAVATRPAPVPLGGDRRLGAADSTRPEST